MLLLIQCIAENGRDAEKQCKEARKVKCETRRARAAYPWQKGKRSETMNFFDTVAGYNFTSYVVPELIDVIEKLTVELKRANDLNERKVKEEQKCVEEQ